MSDDSANAMSSSRNERKSTTTSPIFIPFVNESWIPAIFIPFVNESWIPAIFKQLQTAFFAIFSEPNGMFYVAEGGGKLTKDSVLRTTSFDKISEPYIRTSSPIEYVPKAHKLYLMYKARIEEKKASMASMASTLTAESIPSLLLRPTSETFNHPCFETPIMPIPQADWGNDI